MSTRWQRLMAAVYSPLGLFVGMCTFVLFSAAAYQVEPIADVGRVHAVAEITSVILLGLATWFFFIAYFVLVVRVLVRSLRR